MNDENHDFGFMSGSACPSSFNLDISANSNKVMCGKCKRYYDSELSECPFCKYGYS